MPIASRSANTTKHNPMNANAYMTRLSTTNLSRFTNPIDPVFLSPVGMVDCTSRASANGARVGGPALAGRLLGVVIVAQQLRDISFAQGRSRELRWSRE